MPGFLQFQPRLRRKRASPAPPGSVNRFGREPGIRSQKNQSPRSGRKHKAWGGAQRNPRNPIIEKNRIDLILGLALQALYCRRLIESLKRYRTNYDGIMHSSVVRTGKPAERVTA